ARGFASAWRRGAVPLLAFPSRAVEGEGGPPPGLRMPMYVTALVEAILLVVWAAAGFGSFWPGWVIIATGLVLALRALHSLRGRLAAIGVFLVLVWAL